MKQQRTVGGVVIASAKALCYLLLFLVSQAIISAVCLLAVSLVAPPGMSEMEMAALCLDQVSVFSALFTLVVLAAFFLLRHKNPLREVGFLRTPGRFVFTAMSMAPLLYALVSTAMLLLPEHWLSAYNEAVSVVSSTTLLSALSTVILAPLTEEVIFRGLILGRLARAMPGWLAVLLSALVFGLAHGQLVWIAYAFLLGVVFGFIRLRSGSIWPTLLLHILFNALGQLISTFPDTLLGTMLFQIILAGAGILFLFFCVLYRHTHPLREEI